MSCPPAVTRPRGPFSELVRKVRGDLRQPGFLLLSVGGCVTPGSPRVPHLGASVCAAGGVLGNAWPLAWPATGGGHGQQGRVRSPGGAGLLSGVTGQEPAVETALQNLLGPRVGVGERLPPHPRFGRKASTTAPDEVSGTPGCPALQTPAPSSARGSLSLCATRLDGLSPCSPQERGAFSLVHGGVPGAQRTVGAQQSCGWAWLGPFCGLNAWGTSVSPSTWGRPKGRAGTGAPAGQAQPPGTHQSGR